MSMRRRDFIAALSGVAALPFAARAQLAIPVIGFLDSEAINPTAARIKAYRQGLAEAGYVEGRNVTIEYRSIEGQYGRLPELAAELIRRKVTVIAVTAGLPGAKAVQSATATIPIVFRLGSDPVASGLVASLNRPGGNVTGVTTLGEELVPKRLEVLHELVPRVTTIAFLVNPANPNPETQSRMQALARTLGLQLHVLHASTERDVDAVFARAAELRAGGLVIGGDAFFRSAVRSTQLATLAMSHKIPAISFVREFTAAGGLMTYEGSLADSYRTFGISTGRILKGDKPAELPVMQSTRVELIINLKTAKALGISVPLSLLARADEVIE